MVGPIGWGPSLHDTFMPLCMYLSLWAAWEARWLTSDWHHIWKILTSCPALSRLNFCSSWPPQGKLVIVWGLGSLLALWEIRTILPEELLCLQLPPFRNPQNSRYALFLTLDSLVTSAWGPFQCPLFLVSLACQSPLSCWCWKKMLLSCSFRWVLNDNGVNYVPFSTTCFLVYSIMHHNEFLKNLIF